MANGKAREYINVRTAKVGYRGERHIFVNVAIVGTDPVEWATLKAFDEKADQLASVLGMAPDALGEVKLARSVYMQVNQENIIESVALNGNARRVFTWVDALPEPEPEPVQDASVAQPEPELAL